MSRALVTGASRGIGKAIAQALVRDGCEVLGTSRLPDSISAGDRITGIRYLRLDLGDAGSIEKLAAEAAPVDVLVCNAGQSQIGAIEELAIDEMRRLFEANLFGSLQLIRRILPEMRRRGSGTIIAIGSMASVSPVPFLSTYASSKAALTASLLSLRHEVASKGIKVAVVAPFDIHTTIPLDIRYDDRSAYMPDIARVHAVRDKALAEAPEPEVVARTVLSILHTRKPRFFNPTGRGAAMNAFLLRHLPERIVERIIRRLFKIR